MKSKFLLIVSIALVLVLLAGCGIESIPMPSLPQLDIGTSSLTAAVEYVNGRTCRICVITGDSHFDEGDILQLTFTNLEGSKSIAVGNQVSFEYDYTTQVSEHLGSPHITVNQVRVG